MNFCYTGQYSPEKGHKTVKYGEEGAGPLGLRYQYGYLQI